MLPPVVRFVAFTPDGRWLISRSWCPFTGGDIGIKFRVWDPQTCGLVATPAGKNLIGAIAFSRDGKIMASVGNRGVILWSVNDWKRVADFDLPSPVVVSSITFTSDGKMIVTCHDDGKVRYWNTTTGRNERTLSLTAIARGGIFAPNGKLIAADVGEEVIVWDAAAGTVVARFGDPEYHVSRLVIRFSPDSTKLAIGGEKWTTIHGVTSRTGTAFIDTGKWGGFRGR